eukprot:CAMPEP_0195643904 /NCGR_PEP_ID=MMETSP0815-20121206/28088_1 /TAXON_ID=97485 /ORGANISM="Prymnesium parvum, Strain Texoma1" /LENGTH=167 /DNA_ID=CAMNT_0040786985 /DNA_START=354 /DNA_END=853 /DNA_ORIENTATION=-
MTGGRSLHIAQGREAWLPLPLRACPAEANDEALRDFAVELTCPQQSGFDLRENVHLPRHAHGTPQEAKLAAADEIQDVANLLWRPRREHPGLSARDPVAKEVGAHCYVPGPSELVADVCVAAGVKSEDVVNHQHDASWSLGGHGEVALETVDELERASSRLLLRERR